MLAKVPYGCPINGDCFLLCVEQVLVPSLHPGDPVIADNLQSHKRREVREALRQTGARLLFRPIYSPDLNPIERVFVKLKHLLRKAAACTQRTVSLAIGNLLDSFTAAECANYFRNSGYATT